MIKTISTITSTTNKSQNKGDRLIPFEKYPPELLVKFGNWKECPISGGNDEEDSGVPFPIAVTLLGQPSGSSKVSGKQALYGTKTAT
jgi:hypothetical protein